MKQNKFSTLIVTVQNKPGVLYRISGLIRKRRFNIASLTVSATEDPDMSRFTIVVEGDKETVEKMAKQLYRIIEVIKVNEPEEDSIVARELGLIKVSTTKTGSKGEISLIADHFRAKVIQVTPEYMMLEITGNEEKIQGFYKNMKKYGVMEFVRTGRTALFK
ncbi:acetolactate synthase small subunit [Candidatus Gottesmanbacteria bacterium RIFCSPHIGHO2_02_FULL_39_11]|uniref:Acetolactate synthase small subunit n=1 Tax=Candidatus Gottesmanbacteria bacterium RIFCSPHIGHO2_02_FULL_39_11 TaxID=1798382 RepID=A0A1F5ZTG0_9BACT|nr:MAG: acetolactate synthase small subunit [Candidatus Gottesmanbacteria bacterium RIFCSPHIGHO2_02_FULL_39_11]